MCGVTRAPFNSNRSSCGIEVVVPFFFYPKFEHAQMFFVPMHRLLSMPSGAKVSLRCLTRRCSPFKLLVLGQAGAHSIKKPGPPADGPGGLLSYFRLLRECHRGLAGDPRTRNNAWRHWSFRVPAHDAFRGNNWRPG